MAYICRSSLVFLVILAILLIASLHDRISEEIYHNAERPLQQFYDEIRLKKSMIYHLNWKKPLQPGCSSRSPQHFQYDNTARQFDVVVVGAGLSGAVIAEQYASMLGMRVLVVEKRDHIGGNCYDYEDPDTGIRVNKYGAHLFHTNSEEVWNYVHKFSEWSKWEHRVLGYVNSKYIPIPVNIDTVNWLFNASLDTSSDMRVWLQQHQVLPDKNITNSEEMALSRVGRELYELIFKPYTEKQWNTTASSLGPEVTGRIPVRDNRDDRYFTDKYQALPAHGYTAFFENMLCRNPFIEVHTNTDYFNLPFALKARIASTAKIFYTGPIDQFFSAEKRLQYRSLKFSRIVTHNQKGYSLPAPVVNYPGTEFAFTRVVEYKHMLSQKSSSSVLFYEYPSDTGEPYYPVPTQENKALYNHLLNLTKAIPDVTFVGRLANYRYFNMDEAIANALSVFRSSVVPADVHVVVSVYKENIDWLKRVCDGLKGRTVRWFIFNKHDKDVKLFPWTKPQCITLGWHVANLPNVGREGHSWLTYIQTGVFAPTNVFLQGNVEGSLLENIHAVLEHSMLKEKPSIVPLSTVLCTPDNNQSLDMDFFHEELSALTSYLSVSLNSVCYFYRGQFIASNTALERARTLHAEYIGNVLMPALENNGNNPPMGHAMERMWLTFLVAH
jgi:UDP-galactopyranose mutase